jgi:PAS domain S-box-containing protein
VGFVFAALSFSTDTIAYAPVLNSINFTRKTGAIYPLFATYCILVFGVALTLMTVKWHRAEGLARAQLRYLGVGALFSITGGLTTNLVFPLVTGRSSLSWLGPYFLLPFVVLVAYAIIRLRLMDLRLVVHRGLTIAAATLASLAPVGLFLLFAWSRLSTELGRHELVILLSAIVASTLLVAPTRDLAGRIFDRYLYRTHANFRRTVREASTVLTRELNLNRLLAFVTQTVRASTATHGAAVYLIDGDAFARAPAQAPADVAAFQAPERMPDLIANALGDGSDCLVTDEVLRRSDTPVSRQLHAALEHLRWALVVPVVADDGVIGAVVVGRKRSGDAFYPHDMDLLLTLANHAGIAITNARLYTEVVLANQHIQNIVETIESGVVAVNAAGRIGIFNREAERLTGRSADDVRGRSLDTLPDDLAGLLQATVTDGEARTQPEIPMAAAGLVRPVICTTSPLRDPAGVTAGAVAVFSDLTPVKELENERRRGERLAQFEALASSIAHEIKNPLVAIKTFAQLIPRRQNDPRFIDEFSRVVTREIERMERLVTRLRMLSRPNDRPRQRLDVHAPLLEATEFLHHSFEEKRIRLEVTQGPAPAFLFGDQAELEALFINLLLNAYEATPPGGSVHAGVMVQTESVVVTVSDSGPGIPAEQLERVFDPFFTTKPHGSGLGLTICAGIAAAHRAKLRASNTPAGGAVFTVEFPAAVLVDPAPDEVKARG